MESIGMQGVRFVFGIILARLLFPEQFGLIGMLWVFIAVAQSFTDSGYGAALIQKQDTTATDINTIFYFNIAVGLIAMGVVCLFAPWIAVFFNQPELTSLTRAMSAIILINSFAIIHFTMIHIRLDFKTLTKVSFVESALSGVVGVTLAVMGFGVWSLVAQQVSASILRTLLLWVLNSWRPAFVFSFGSLRQLFGFGSRMLASGLLDQIFSNIYSLVIGKLFSATDLGYFTRARTFQEIPTNTLSGLVSRVVFPVFSSIQDDSSRLKAGLKKAVSFLVMIHFPMMIGLAVIARPLVLTLLTDKWAECIPYLQLLCFAGLLYPVHLMNLNILMALGRSDLFLRLEIIKKVLIVISIAITWRWGISTMIYGLICLSFLCFYLNSYYTGILIGYTVGEQLRDLSPYLVMAVLMGTAVYAVGSLPFLHQGSMLVAELVTGSVLYVFLCRLFRLAAFMEIWEACCNKIAVMRA
jgi:O-antigen/teichoic acid export membrane protein